MPAEGSRFEVAGWEERLSEWANLRDTVCSWTAGDCAYSALPRGLSSVVSWTSFNSNAVATRKSTFMNAIGSVGCKIKDVDLRKVVSGGFILS